MDEFRKTEVLVNEEWLEIPFMQLKKGDNFRLTESDGEIVMGPDGDTVFVAVSDAEISPEYGVGTITIESEENKDELIN
jgi:hypothetical protein